MARSPFIWAHANKAKNLANDVYSDWIVDTTNGILRNAANSQTAARVTTKYMEFRRDRNYLVWRFQFDVTGAALGGSGGAVFVKLPTWEPMANIQLTIDPSKNPNGTAATNPGRAFYGPGQWFQVGTGWKQVQWSYAGDALDAQHIRPYEIPGTIVDTSMADGSSLKAYDIRVPILEFT